MLLVVCPCGTSPKIGCELTGNDVLEKFLPVLHLLISPNPQPRESLGHHRRFHNQFPPFCSVLHCTLGLGESRPVHSLMLSSHLFFCVPCLPPSFTVPCKMVLLARPDERETCPYHFSLHLFMVASRSSCGPIAFWILVQIS